jgi:hypothetical protein
VHPRSIVALALAPAAALLLAACPPPGAPRAPTGAGFVGGKGFTGCLPLVGTSRASLRLGPDRTYLYWTEQVRLHGYEDAWPSTSVVRWPIDGGPVETLTNLLENPYRVLADGRVVGVRKDAGVTVWSPSGSELVSLSGQVDHLELLAGEKAVVYREGSSIYRQPVHRQAARWLTYADALLGVDGQAVIIRNEDGDHRNHLQRVDGNTGAITELPWIDDVAKALPGALVIQNELGIGLRPPEGGATRTVLTGDGWKIAVGPDAVKAWRRVGPRLDGAIVTAAGADNLPPVLGGDSLEGFVRFPDGRIAYLVGHDLDGDDEVTTGDEVDLCLAAGASKEVRVEPRTAPSRWREAGLALAALAKDRLGGATWHFAAGDAVPGVYLEAKVERADDAAIRADIRAVSDALVAATGDLTLYVDISYPHGKRGFSEWWSGTGRRVAWTGTGGATVPDLDDYDLLIATEELADVPVEEDEESALGGEGGPVMARCRGTVKNTSDRTLTELVADCVSGVEDDPIDVFPANLGPGQTGRFDGVVRRARDANLAVSIHSGNGRDELPGFERSRHERYLRIARTAAEIADRTDLVYKDASAGGAQVTVHLAGPDGFERWSGQAQELAATTAADLLEKLGAVPLGAGTLADLQRKLRGEQVSVEAETTIRLRITAGDRTWWYEDDHLTGGDED